MANYYGQWRTNYFKVKNKKKFLAWAKTIPEAQASIEEDGCIITMSDDCDYGSIPNNRLTKKGNPIDFDFLSELAPHLADDEVAVVMETGAEKLRYLIGYAGAINNKGNRIEISIHDITKLASTLGKNITACEY